MKITLRFTLRRQSKDTSSSAVCWVYLKIRINGVAARSAMATGVSCQYKDWDTATQAIRGRADSVAEKNKQLDQIKADLLEIFNRRRQQENPITAELLKSMYAKRAATDVGSILAAGDDFLAEHTPTVATGTSKNNKLYHNNLRKYILDKFKRKDLDFAEITPKWTKAYYNYHATENGKTYAAKNASWVRRIINYAVEEGLLEYNPLLALIFKRDKPKPIFFLAESELQKLHTCEVFSKKQQNVVDAFLFQCYTGMAYCELLQFNARVHLQTDAKEHVWIKIYRGKSQELCLVPMLKQAAALLEKYNGRPPVISNQRMNDYIKEAARVAGLENTEQITTHVGRRTAGTFYLNRGVSLLTVSKILGHKSVKTTERYYAALLTETIYKDVAAAGLV
jgi:integrase